MAIYVFCLAIEVAVAAKKKCRPGSFSTAVRGPISVGTSLMKNWIPDRVTQLSRDDSDSCCFFSKLR